MANLNLVVNFIQRPLPDQSTTGALVPGVSDWSNESPGALGMGQQASTGLTLCKCDQLSKGRLTANMSNLLS